MLHDDNPFRLPWWVQRIRKTQRYGAAEGVLKQLGHRWKSGEKCVQVSWLLLQTDEKYLIYKQNINFVKTYFFKCTVSNTNTGLFYVSGCSLFMCFFVVANEIGLELPTLSPFYEIFEIQLICKFQCLFPFSIVFIGNLL